MKPITLSCYGLFALGIVLWLVQLWFTPWDPILFYKLILTDGVVLFALVVLAYLLREAAESKKRKTGKELD